jgi:ABC-2 type transport system permease protein
MEILFWPMVGLLSLGIMGDFLDLKENMLAFILTGVVTAGVLQVTQLDVSYSLLYDIWSKSIKQTFLSPVTQYDYIVGSWIIGIGRGTIVFILLTFFSKEVFGLILPDITRRVVFAAGIFLSALVIGMLVCLLIMLFGQRVEISAWSLSHLLMLICGVYYPVSYLPQPFMSIASALPLTYFLEYYRSFYGFTPVFPHSLIKGFLLGGIYVFGLLWCLRYAFRRARKTGMILKLSE